MKQIDRKSEVYARVLDIQRMSTEDGPGIRTTIFFKGCTLKCTWCHNPESISALPQVHWIDSRCIGCRNCLNTCPKDAIVFESTGITINRKRCDGCGQCADRCPSTAMSYLGSLWDVDALFSEAMKDRVYYEKSGGGITISGGEPTLQFYAAVKLFKQLHEAGIHTAIDTCGLYPSQSLFQLLPYTDMILYDIKEMDPNRHKKFTGHSNKTILKNLMDLSNYIANHHLQKTLWIRTPIIPNATATPENIIAIGNFLAKHLNGFVSRWDLCAFNNLCKDKYLRLGLNWSFKNAELLTEECMVELADIAKTSGVDPDLVQWSGMTQQFKIERKYAV
ncbi:MAG: glycyl-radical enzyme activating protein [Desulfobacterales bacterium]|nr:glycyl-radical enzyme activating protein [Desulfobacterales bacterium]